MKVRVAPCHLRHPVRPKYEYAGVSPAQLVEISGLDPDFANGSISVELEKLLDHNPVKLTASVILVRIKLSASTPGTLNPSAIRELVALLLTQADRPEQQIVAGQVVRSKAQPTAFDVFCRPDTSHFPWKHAVPFSAFRLGEGHGTAWAQARARKRAKNTSRDRSPTTPF